MAGAGPALAGVVVFGLVRGGAVVPAPPPVVVLAVVPGCPAVVVTAPAAGAAAPDGGPVAGAVVVGARRSLSDARGGAVGDVERHRLLSRAAGAGGDRHGYPEEQGEEAQLVTARPPFSVVTHA